jgi:glycogen phosphorylase
MLETQPFDARVRLPEPLAHLRELALNLRWTWDRETRDLFQEIYPGLWNSHIYNPWLVLRGTSIKRLDEMAADPTFKERVERVHAGLQRYMAERAWYHKAHPEEEETLVAYFTAECGLTEALPIYAGGLGILSGDHLKSASALGVPLVGVSLLYQEGYSRQMLDANGWQVDSFPSNTFETMPLRVERNADGWPLVVEVPLPGRTLSLLVWRAQVGRTALYLLDANIAINSPVDRGITSQLYGGNQEMRIEQEIALGIGGWRALAAVGLRPTVCHLNEGHAAFAILERARDLAAETGSNFWEALAATSAGNVFTTHTPVPAGFDIFPPDLVARYFTPYAQELGISVNDLIGLGRVEAWNSDEPFNMALLALNHVNSCNGVSKLHADVSRHVFGSRFRRFAPEEVPITAVTNGTHTDSWLSGAMEALLQRYVGPTVDEQPEQADWSRVETIPDAEIWACRNTGRQRLVEFARERLRRQMGQRGLAPTEAAARAGQALDPDALTIGFARRFATYKRATLFLRDVERIRRMLLDLERPIQFVVAGKAHPQDHGGKELIQQVFQFAERPDVRHRIVFLEDYDMRVTGRMIQGVDVWLNTPRRPMEASGTSGMKVLPNGGLNLSICDGWWAEAYEPGVGWAFGTQSDEIAPEQQDAIDAEQLYEVLSREVIPLYYDRGRDGIPHGWIAMVKRSMHRLCPVFNTNRMVAQYVEEHYLPAGQRYRDLTANNLSSAKSLAGWEASVRTHWGNVQVEQTVVRATRGRIASQARVRLGPLLPADIAVELYAPPPNGGAPETVPMTLKATEDSAAWYEAQVPQGRSPADYTVRVLPAHPAARQPLDMPLVTWGKD